jgi:hypothetical protein
MTIVSVFLVSCVAVPSNRKREVRFHDGGLFEAKKKMSQTCVAQSDRCRLLRRDSRWAAEGLLRYRPAFIGPVWTFKLTSDNAEPEGTRSRCP